MAVPDVDASHTYHGFWAPGAVCRIRIYRPPGFPPVVVATEVPENENTSITNVVLLAPRARSVPIREGGPPCVTRLDATS
jgi:hypothetical protein